MRLALLGALVYVGCQYMCILIWGESLVYIHVAGLVLLVAIFYLIYEANIEDKLGLISQRRFELTTEQGAIQHFIGLIRFIDYSEGESLEASRLLKLYTVYHNSFCLCAECPLCQLWTQAVLNTETKAKTLAALAHAVAVHFREAIMQHVNSVRLKIFYASYISKYLKNYIIAWATIDNIPVSECTLIELFHLFTLKSGLALM
jgi:hypothetical protein